MKNNRNGQAETFSAAEYAKIRKNIYSQKYKLLLDIAYFTGERWGALIKLRISDVYNEDGTPRKIITFRARTRKAVGGKTKKQKTRQVPVHPTLKESLLAHAPDRDSEWLFPGRRSYTKDESPKHITLRYADMMLRQAIDRAGLASRGFSTHSTRRSFATHLARNGVSLKIIQKLMGYTDIRMVLLYVDTNEDDLAGAIATL